jgi:hypothetical protein
MKADSKRLRGRRERARAKVRRAAFLRLERGAAKMLDRIEANMREGQTMT